MPTSPGGSSDINNFIPMVEEYGKRCKIHLVHFGGGVSGHRGIDRDGCVEVGGDGAGDGRCRGVFQDVGDGRGGAGRFGGGLGGVGGVNRVVAAFLGIFLGGRARGLDLGLGNAAHADGGEHGQGKDMCSGITDGRAGHGVHPSGEERPPYAGPDQPPVKSGQPRLNGCVPPGPDVQAA